MYEERRKTKCCGEYIHRFYSLGSTCPSCGEQHYGIDSMTIAEVGRWVQPAWWKFWVREWRPKDD